MRGELLSMDYPVCREHASGLAFANLLTRKTLGLSLLRLMIWICGPMAVLGLALAGFRLVLGVQTRNSLPGEMIALTIVFAVAFVLLIRAYRRLPLRLVKRTEDSVTIQFKNDGYGVEFARLNRAHLSERT
jgi:hypothetical protein